MPHLLLELASEAKIDQAVFILKHQGFVDEHTSLVSAICRLTWTPKQRLSQDLIAFVVLSSPLLKLLRLDYIRPESGIAHF